MPYQRNKLYLN
ncbi:UNVERIFIED_CONTAM: hypothetical protein GTU68_054230 [Idotea baltica]|nr:hypothetical protein [Idotea baltica]